jgi:hypothetical protein
MARSSHRHLHQDAGLGYFSSNTGKEKGVRFCESNVRTDIFGSFAICQAHCQICAFISKLSPTSITSNDVLGLYLNVGEMRNWYPHFIYDWHSYRGTTEKTQRRNFHSSVAMHFVRESLLALCLWDNGGGTECFWCRKSLYSGLALPPPPCALFVTPINVNNRRRFVFPLYDTTCSWDSFPGANGRGIAPATHRHCRRITMTRAKSPQEGHGS